MIDHASLLPNVYIVIYRLHLKLAQDCITFFAILQSYLKLYIGHN
jgi:hypothetical protein